MDAIKSGWKTSEFWKALAVSICGLLVTTGVFTPDQSNDIVKAVGELSGAIIMAVSTGAYIISRAKVKSNEKK